MGCRPQGRNKLAFISGGKRKPLKDCRGCEGASEGSGGGGCVRLSGPGSRGLTSHGFAYRNALWVNLHFCLHCFQEEPACHSRWRRRSAERPMKEEMLFRKQTKSWAWPWGRPCSISHLLLLSCPTAILPIG